MAYAHTHAANPHWLPRAPKNALDAIPGNHGWPLVGNTLKMLRDPQAFGREMVGRYGNIYRTNSFGGPNIVMMGPEANELVLFDRDKIFSSEQGWGPLLNLLFPRGLMLLDFDKHRADRRILAVAFKPEPMRLYAEALDAGIGARAESWRGQRLRFYDAIKALTLDLAATSFLGIPLGPEADLMNKAFTDEVQATIAPVRLPLPGTAMRKGVRARAYLAKLFGREIAARRTGDGDDIFSVICRATDESGATLSDDAIIDHMNFLMMAAHDTITSSATTMVMLLARYPEWQEKLRQEYADLGLNRDDGVPYGKLESLTLTEYAFKEALRMMPPVPSLPRRALKDFSFGGYDIPAGTHVGISPAWTHQMAEHWPEPKQFDPMRFEPERSRGRHKYAWVPFGGGAHMCLGLHFAYMQIKLLMFHMLTRYRIEIDEGAGTEWQAWPIPRPRDGLPVKFVPL